MSETENQPSDPENVPDREVDPASDPEPRGNPQVDEPDVDKGQEQIDKVVGN
jgi:hypothetical protein